MLQSLLIWTVLGLVAGIIAKIIMPGNQSNSLITTVLLGIAGSYIGGWVGSLLGIGQIGVFSIVGIATAVGGAILLMFVWGLISGKK
jgi:uncharacterized membrane protein YeaQ/YmgE (transglycosylase-associated protein family)